MDLLQKIVTDIELLDAEAIRYCFEHGLSPNTIYKAKPLIFELISGYGRGKAFSQCVQVFVDHGLVFDDDALLAVLLNDADRLDQVLRLDPSAGYRKYSLPCAFTQMVEVSLLHICAEYDHLHCAKLLVTLGMDVNERAGVDENGFGAQTPIFHTVNQHNNICINTMQYLLALGADLGLTLKGLVWGKGYEWETFIPAVNPISYAMMGLLRQFQRKEKDIYEVVNLLMKAAYDVDHEPPNIPNKYLSK